jgi:Flp pilus assembly pilin Flp
MKLWKDRRGQDLVEYALVAAFLVTTFCAITPTMAPAVSTVFSKLSGTLVQAANDHPGAAQQVLH